MRQKRMSTGELTQGLKIVQSLGLKCIEPTWARGSNKKIAQTLLPQPQVLHQVTSKIIQEHRREPPLHRQSGKLLAKSAIGTRRKSYHCRTHTTNKPSSNLLWEESEVCGMLVVTMAAINPLTSSTATQTDSIELSARKSVLVSKCKYLRFYCAHYAMWDIQSDITSHTGKKKKKRQEPIVKREKQGLLGGSVG